MPSGLPDVDSISAYGGAKADYAPVEDASTDLSADEWNLIAANMAGLTQTAPRAWCAFVGNASTPTDPGSNVHGAVWGNTAGVKPVVARTGTGTYTITWPTTVSDPLNVSHTLAIRRGWGQAEGSTFYHVQVTPTAANVATVHVGTTGGSMSDAIGVTIVVYVI